MGFAAEPLPVCNPQLMPMAILLMPPSNATKVMTADGGACPFTIDLRKMLSIASCCHVMPVALSILYCVIAFRAFGEFLNLNQCIRQCGSASPRIDSYNRSASHVTDADSAWQNFRPATKSNQKRSRDSRRTLEKLRRLCRKYQQGRSTDFRLQLLLLY